MSEPLDVDTLLSRIAQEGRLESSGAFTLDSSRLREKLSRYRLTNPWQYLWFAVRAAVAGQARRVVIDSGREFRSTFVELEMPALDLASIARLSDTSLVGRENRALSHLAIAFEAALALKHRVSSVEIHSGEHLLTSLPGGGIELRARVPEPGEAGLRMRVVSPWWRAIWNAALEGWHTAEVFHNVGIPVTDNGSVRNVPPGTRGLSYGDGSYYSNWTAPGHSWNVAVLSPRWNAGLLPCGGVTGRTPQAWLLAQEPGAPVVHAEPDQAAAVPWLSLQRQPARGAWAVLWDCDQLTWIMDGIPVDVERSVSGKGRWGGVAVADGLRLDLSANRIVRDDDYRRRLAWLGSIVKLHSTNRPPQ